jgi:hypothetical protein
MTSIGKNRIISVIRWTVRIVCLLIIGLFLLFFVGEGSIGELSSLSFTEISLMIFIPLLFTLGVIVSFKKELIGGVLIILSVIGFNAVDRIASGQLSGEFEFASLVIPGILFIVLWYLSNKLKKSYNV